MTTDLTTITVPAVAAALLTVPRDCETCGNSREVLHGAPFHHHSCDCEWDSTPCSQRFTACPDCRMVCEWIATDERVEVGSTVHIVAGPLDDEIINSVCGEFGDWDFMPDGAGGGSLRHGPTFRAGPTFGKNEAVIDVLFPNTPAARRAGHIPLRPGVVVAQNADGILGSRNASRIACATGVVAEFWPIDAPLRFGERFGERGLDISDQRFDQDWSPTRPCPECDGWGDFFDDERVDDWMGHLCPDCDGAGTLPRNAIRLTEVRPV